MKRDFILVCGMQGLGKSVWTQAYADACKRLFVFDPKGAFRNVDFMSDPKETIDAILDRRVTEFRYGSYLTEDIEMLGNAAYAAQQCTFVMEECKMLFDRGEDIAPWARPLIYMGREPQLNLVLVAQRVIAIPPDIRSQASRVVTFAQAETSDCKALSARFGGDFEDEIRTLPPLHCLDWQLGEGVKRYAVRY